MWQCSRKKHETSCRIRGGIRRRCFRHVRALFSPRLDTLGSAECSFATQSCSYSVRGGRPHRGSDSVHVRFTYCRDAGRSSASPPAIGHSGGWLIVRWAATAGLASHESAQDCARDDAAHPSSSRAGRVSQMNTPPNKQGYALFVRRHCAVGDYT